MTISKRLLRRDSVRDRFVCFCGVCWAVAHRRQIEAVLVVVVPEGLEAVRGDR